MGQGHLTAATQDRRTDGAQEKLKQAQLNLERWQQSLSDLIPSPSGRLDAETVRWVPLSLHAVDSKLICTLTLITCQLLVPGDLCALSGIAGSEDMRDAVT